MRCHYEVLGVARDVDDDELKGLPQGRDSPSSRQEPDNVGSGAERFKEIQAAYAVLGDPHERRWYDSHREAILRGGDGTRNDDESDDEEPDQPVVVLRPGAFNGPSATAPRASTRRTPASSTRSTSTRRRCTRRREHTPMPAFGTSKTAWAEVRAFYAAWEGFTTARTFSSADEYDLRAAPNRHVRRAMEKENGKLRGEARKKAVDCVRALVAYVKKRDKRVIARQAHAAREEEAKRERQRSERAARRASTTSRRRRRRPSARRAGTTRTRLKLDALMRRSRRTTPPTPRRAAAARAGRGRRAAAAAG